MTNPPDSPPGTHVQGSWRIANVSRTGSRHLRHGQVCEDSAGWFIDSELVAIAVADGAGSAPRSALGSAAAVRAAILAVMDRQWTLGAITLEVAPKVLSFAFESAAKALLAEAAAVGGVPDDFACTLIAVIAGRDFVAAAHVGDGAAVVCDSTGHLFTLSTPTNGAFANETALLGCGQSWDVTVTTLASIGPKRLAALPWAPRCIQCQNAADRGSTESPIESLVNAA